VTIYEDPKAVMHDFIPVAFVVQFIIAISLYFGGHGRHEVDADGVDVFRMNPAIAWIVTIGTFAIAVVLGYAIMTLTPNPLDAPLAIILGEVQFFIFGIYGVYCITMRIRVDSESLRVSSILGTRVTYFRHISLITDRETGRYRTLEVIDVHGKRIAIFYSSYLPDYGDLVSSLQQGIRRNHSPNESTNAQVP
jgi:hypothetical protein